MGVAKREKNTSNSSSIEPLKTFTAEARTVIAREVMGFVRIVRNTSHDNISVIR